MDKQTIFALFIAIRTDSLRVLTSRMKKRTESNTPVEKNLPAVTGLLIIGVLVTSGEMCSPLPLLCYPLLSVCLFLRYSETHTGGKKSAAVELLKGPVHLDY